jgi:hypothetical protein
MHLKLLVLTFAAFISMNAQCVAASAPITPQTTADGNSGITSYIPFISTLTTPQTTEDGNSGISGTTLSNEISGVPGGATTSEPASIEFAIAPVEADEPAYDKAIFVISDEQGMFMVELPPGTYWIGAKAKALDPVEYVPGAVVFSEMVVVVEDGTFTPVELVQTGYAP